MAHISSWSINQDHYVCCIFFSLFFVCFLKQAAVLGNQSHVKHLTIIKTMRLLVSTRLITWCVLFLWVLEGIILPPFYTWGNWGSQRLYNRPKATQSVRSKAVIQSLWDWCPEPGQHSTPLFHSSLELRIRTWKCREVSGSHKLTHC